MRAIIYARTATLRQGVAPGSDPVVQRQLAACRAHCVAQSHRVVRELVDAGVSGLSGARDVLNVQTLGDAEVVVVEEVSRISRDIEQLNRFRADLGRVDKRLEFTR